MSEVRWGPGRPELVRGGGAGGPRGGARVRGGLLQLGDSAGQPQVQHGALQADLRPHLPQQLHQLQRE